MELSLEQQNAFDKFILGENVFVTGSAGSGKSELIRKIYRHCISNRKGIQVCALTGCASILLNCKAKTVHSWSGIGLGNASVDVLINKIKQNIYKKKAWTEISVLVIDEVSMMSIKLFDTLDAIGRGVRNNHLPFGGIQVILSGDFYQLPPVGNYNDVDTMRFCFESEDWNNVFKKNCQIQLVKIFRQTDNKYISILNQVREGVVKRSSNDLLKSRVGLIPPEGTVITQLYPRRNSVEVINCNKMKELTTPEHTFEIQLLTNLPLLSDEDKRKRNKIGKVEIDIELHHIKTNLLCEPTLKLKVGAYVMCIVNMEISSDIVLCNGSQGIITGFSEITRLPIVRFNNGYEVTINYYTWTSENIPGIGVSQIPLILAWAITIHKSQGTTLDMAQIDVGRGIFEAGQTYVALSRVKSLDGIYLTSFDVTRIKINRKVKEFYDNL
jgi:ATP-dependent DNA helicase PIF1